jgi:hypothetical protein
MTVKGKVTAAVRGLILHWIPFARAVIPHAAHFRCVQSQIRAFSILTKDIWNMDETGLAVGLCVNGYVVSGTGTHRVNVKVSQNRG